MTRLRTLASLLAVGALGLGALAAGCGDDEGARGNVGTLKVGVLVPLSGDLAHLGRAGAQAARLAADQVNAAAGDTGLDLTLAQVDTRTDPGAAQRAATTLIEGDGVSAIAGPWGTPELIPTAENVTIAAGIPLVTPSATGPRLTDLDDDGLVFRTAPSDAIQGRAIARLMAAALGPDATVNAAHRDDSYGTALADEFIAAWRAGGGTIGADVAYDPASARLAADARRIARGDPDGWMIIDAHETWPRMGAALVRTRNWDPARTFTGNGLRSPDLPAEAGAKATEGVRGTGPTSAAAPAGAAFDALWAAEVGAPRRSYDAQTFDAVVLLALAAAAAGSNDPASLAEQLRPVSGPPGTKYTFEQLGEALAAASSGEDIDYEGASGPIDFDDAGDPTAASYGTWTYAAGRLVDGDEVVAIAQE